MVRIRSPGCLPWRTTKTRAESKSGCASIASSRPRQAVGHLAHVVGPVARTHHLQPTSFCSNLCSNLGAAPCRWVPLHAARSCGGVGWPTGLEPVTSGATTRRSRHHSCVKPAGSWPRLLQTAAISRSNARSQSQHAGAAEHRGVADVERCTASGQRHDVVDGRVGGAVGVALVAGAPVAVLAKPRSQHVGAESLPGPRAGRGRCTGSCWTAGRGRCSG